MKYVIFVNNGIFSFNDKTIFTKEQVLEQLKDWANDDIIKVDGKELTVEELFDECLEYTIDVECDSMVEYGDDFVSLGIFEVKE